MISYTAMGTTDGTWDDFGSHEALNATITKGDSFSVEVGEDGWFDITVADFNEESCRIALARANNVGVEDVEVHFPGICISI